MKSVRMDLVGQKYNFLTVLKFAGLTNFPSGGHKAIWWCRCDCGKRVKVIGSNLRNGQSKSCGCWDRKVSGERWATHGATRGHKLTPEYIAWRNARARCTKSKHYKNYKNYAGRGITVCARWQNSFENFLADMGKRPRGLTLDRKDNDGNYEPLNCWWATQQQQCLNRRTWQIERKKRRLWGNFIIETFVRHNYTGLGGE